ncbi:hypothetical protein ACHAXA_009872 [Cyclostephanos tholiformis]|uniref:Uncharacterized protein n=1 Tax=Cyclostephanos tholiformis TaxID=382380 RepID=A0ABD3RFI8_9STRA
MALKFNWHRRKKDKSVDNDGTTSPRSSKEAIKAGAGEASETAEIAPRSPQSAVAKSHSSKTKNKKRRGAFSTFEVKQGRSLNELEGGADCDDDENNVSIKSNSIKAPKSRKAVKGRKTDKITKSLNIVKEQKQDKISHQSQTTSWLSLEVLNAPMDIFNQLMSCTSTCTRLPVREGDLLSVDLLNIPIHILGDASTNISARVYSWPLTKPDTRSVIAAAKDKAAKESIAKAKELTLEGNKLRVEMAYLKDKICKLDEVNAQAACKAVQATEKTNALLIAHTEELKKVEAKLEKTEAVRIAHTEELQNMEAKLRSESALVSELKAQNSQLLIEIESARALQKAYDKIRQNTELAKQANIANISGKAAFDDVQEEIKLAKLVNNTGAQITQIQVRSTETEDDEFPEQATAVADSVKKANHCEDFQALTAHPSLGNISIDNDGDDCDNIVVKNQNNQNEKGDNFSYTSSGGRSNSLRSSGGRRMAGWLRKFVGISSGFATDDGSQSLSTLDKSVQSCKRDSTVTDERQGTQESFSEESFDDDASGTYSGSSDDDTYDSSGLSSSYSTSFDSRAEIKDLESSASIVSESTAEKINSSVSKSVSNTFESETEGTGSGENSIKETRWFNTSEWSKALILNLQQEGRDELEEEGAEPELEDSRTLTLVA